MEPKFSRYVIHTHLPPSPQVFFQSFRLGPDGRLIKTHTNTHIHLVILMWARAENHYKNQGKFLWNYFGLIFFTWNRLGHGAKGQVLNLECSFVTLWFPGGNKRVKHFYQRSSFASWLHVVWATPTITIGPLVRRPQEKGELVTGWCQLPNYSELKLWTFKTCLIASEPWV